jgi:peptidoglycan hydrolase CwlO-like protein
MSLSSIIAEASPQPASTGEAVILVLVSILTLGNLAWTWVQRASGKGTERQIEPTAIAALSQKIDDALAERPDIARELGAMRASLDTLVEELSELRRTHREEIANTHKRIDLISEKLAATSARVDSIERQCGRC